MKKKLLGIFVCMLLIATALPVVGTMNINVRDSNDVTLASTDGNYDVTPAPPFWWLIGADQKQTSHCKYGVTIFPPYWIAQEFKPTKNELTAVALEFFKAGNPLAGLEITVSIRESLNGNDLTELITVNADHIKSGGTWVLFDFQDITVTPENTYYIVCRGGGGTLTDCYYWLFDVNNTYTRGIAWESDDNGTTWYDLEIAGQFEKIDCCFITYWQKPINRAVNTPFLNFLENHPNLFPILRYLLGL